MIPEASERSTSNLQRMPVISMVSMAFVCCLAFALRLHNLDAIGVAPDRQYRSFLIARAIYFQSADDIPQWRKDVAETSRRRQEPLEPPITETVVALLYRIAGTENFSIARLVCASFWLIGAIPLYFLAKKGAPEEGAVLAAFYFLLTPFGVLLSLSFLPESLMILMFLVSLLLIYDYHADPSSRRLFLSALVSALAVFIKPLVVFAILGAFAALAIGNKRRLGGLLSLPCFFFAVTALLPSALFYGYGVFIDQSLRWKVEVSFLPHLFLSREFWKGWLLVGTRVVGLAPLIAALVGAPMLPGGVFRNLNIGLATGYLGFCLFFNYFIYFAEYYHSQLIILVALSLGPLLAVVAIHLKRSVTRWWEWSTVFSALLLLTLFVFLDVQSRPRVLRWVGEETAAEIGEIVEHSSRVAYVAFVYGLPLEYHGELAGEHFPRRRRGWPLEKATDEPRTVEERLASLGFWPEYFVVTNLGEFSRHHDDLRAFLEQRCELVAKTDSYLIYSVPEHAQIKPAL